MSGPGSAGLPLPPVFGGVPVFGAAPGFRRDPLGTFAEAWRLHGSPVRFAGPVPVTMITRPDDLRRVLLDRIDDYPHPASFDRKMGVGIGQALVTSEGAEWRRQRDLIAPVFRREGLRRFATIMTERATELLDRWAEPARAGRPFDVRAELQRLTLQILVDSLFSSDWSDRATELADAVKIILEHVNGKLIAPIDLPEFVPTRRNLRFRRASRTLNATVDRLIAERRARDDLGSDLLAMIMAAGDHGRDRGARDGGALGDRALRDHVLTLFVAGHETVATALTWICYLIATRPREAADVRDELAATVGDRPAGAEDLPRLRALRAFIAEALRLYPPLWQLPRTPLVDDVLGGRRIPAGTFVLINLYLAHRDPEFWPNPEAFDPTRFDRAEVAARPRYAYLPFSAGPRNCVGVAFANLELGIITSAIMNRFRLEAVPARPVEFSPDVSLRSRHPLWMRVHLR